MSNIAVAKKALPKAEQDKLRVVFVTTDPERDTPPVLGEWLTAQDPTFIGLTGDFATIQAGARSVGIGIEPPKKEKDGKLVSTHGAQVLAFSPKADKGYVLYGEDTTRRRLHQGPPQDHQGGDAVRRTPLALGATALAAGLALTACGSGDSSASASSGKPALKVSGAYMPAARVAATWRPASSSSTTAAAPDTLTSVTSAIARRRSPCTAPRAGR